MNKFLKGYFYNPSLGNLKFDEVINQLVLYMQKKPNFFYDIIVGCDSSSGLEPNFPVAIVILRKRQGGRFFLKKIKYKDRKFYNWKQRILEETLLSCELALVLKEEFKKKLKKIAKSFNYQTRYIHTDIGENGITKDMIKEVIGLIKGNGFKPIIKPKSFAASSIADRYS